MEYGKLYTILLGTLVSEKHSAVSHQIVRFILDNLDRPEQISIKNISAQCHVGQATISRFCREIGLQDFFELIEDCRHQAAVSTQNSYRERVEEYRSTIREGIDMVADSVDEKAVRQICEEIHRFDRVAVFGWLKSEAAAFVLQTELAALGKNIYTTISHKQQMEYLKQADERDLIIILSFRGIYFEYFSDPELGESVKAPFIYFVTGSEEPVPEGVNSVLRFKSGFDQNYHPHQLLFLCNIIAREYARIYGREMSGAQCTLQNP